MLREQVAEIARAHPGSRSEVWAYDEHRVGLKPILRRIWHPKGTPAVVSVHPRYAWSWLYGWVRPTTGETYWLILPQVNAAAASLALQAFADAVGAGPAKQIVLVLDRAGWHTAHDVVVPAGLHLVFLPAYSPELQPAERLWPLANEGLANRLFASIDHLEQALLTRLHHLRSQVDLIRTTTCYHWWPTTG